MRASSANQISIVSQSMRLRRAIVSRRLGSFFKSLNRARRLSVVARSGREFAVTHGPQFATECLFGDGDAELLEDPLRQIDQPPANHTVHCRDRTAVDQAGRDLALTVVE